MVNVHHASFCFPSHLVAVSVEFQIPEQRPITVAKFLRQYRHDSRQLPTFSLSGHTKKCSILCKIWCRDWDPGQFRPSFIRWGMSHQLNVNSDMNDSGDIPCVFPNTGIRFGYAVQSKLWHKQSPVYSTFTEMLAKL